MDNSPELRLAVFLWLGWSKSVSDSAALLDKVRSGLEASGAEPEDMHCLSWVVELASQVEATT